jgi:predicted transposase YbfD/YdcC
MLIDPDAFEACFSAWAQSFAEAFDREVVAIDGKTLRRSFDRGRAQGPLHLVSAWASEQGLALGQREVDGKSNEITAIPALLETLSLTNCIVTLDAMHGLPEDDRRPDPRPGCRLPAGAQHSKAFLAVKECCERHCFAHGATARPVFDAFDDSHGRLVRRRVFVCPQAASLEALRAWPGLHTVLAVETIRGVTGSGKVEAEIRYFLSSCRDDPTGLVQAIRRHIENGLHWILDVTFREDDSRVRDRTAARNLAILRKIAINLMGRNRSPRISLWARRKQAPGTMSTCSLYWPDNFMRRPCPTTRAAHETVQVAPAGTAVPVRPWPHSPAQPSPSAPHDRRRVPRLPHQRVRGLEAGDVCPGGRIKVDLPPFDVFARPIQVNVTMPS